MVVLSLGYGAQSANCPDGALNKAHAAISLGSNTYCYDLNGSMVRRTIIWTTYKLQYDAENRMVHVSDGATAELVLDDNKRVIMEFRFQTSSSNRCLSIKLN